MGKHKNIESPDKLLGYFIAYKQEVKAKPFLVKDWVGKDGDQVNREKEKPLTMEGFELYLFEQNVISDLKDYFSNKDDRYKDYAPICSHIKKSIRADQIEGGMAGIYNPSITQRLNGLVEKTQNENDNNNILSGKLSVNVISTGVPLANSEKEVNDSL